VQAREEVKGFEIIILKPNENLKDVLTRLTKKLNLKKIVIDGTMTYYSAVENIKKAVPKIKIVSKNGLLQELRIVKDKKEIALLKKAAQIACRAFLKFLPEIKPGVSEKTLAEKFNAMCKKEGAEAMSFETIIASGPRGALPHARPSDKKVKNGELVVIDWGVKYKGYVSDMTRTVAIGKISPRLKTIYEAVREAQELGCKVAKPGMTGDELDAICRNFLEKAGFGKYFAHATGHGIGLEIHELPVIAPKQKFKLPAGSVITCEPGVYIPGLGGVRIEDSLILTKNGAFNLTSQVTKKLLTLS
jgi:Xaa-Pro aminopeptidase